MRQDATYLCGTAGVPSAPSGRKRLNTPKSFLSAQCSGWGSQLLNSPISATAWGEICMQQDLRRVHHPSMHALGGYRSMARQYVPLLCGIDL